MVRGRGNRSGGFSTAGSASSTLSTSWPSVGCGVHRPTTEDTLHFHTLFCPSTYLAASTLAMFDELAQDAEDAEDYDLEALERHADAHGFREDDDAATLVGRGVGDDAVVFEIGDEEGAGSDDDEAIPKKRRGEEHEGDSHEREGLMKDD